MSRITYASLVERLYPRITHGIRWGLDRTERLLAAVGDPQQRFAVVHVGGTNGKGSVAATVASVLTASGRRTGLYTSPHLVDFRERIQIDGVPIAEGPLLAAADRLWPIIEAEEPTFFEATTAIGFLALADAAVDVAVVEVGMGGRLDATNVVEPAVTVITNVDLDHSQYLGDTPEQIAAEKAGIIKPGIPLVTAARAPALGVLRERAAALDAPVVVVAPHEARAVRYDVEGTAFTMDSDWGELDLRTPLVGLHHALNVAVAVRALESLADPFRPGVHAVRAGVRATHWPGRLERIRARGVDWVLDSAHNPAGVHALLHTLPGLERTGRVVVLVGILGDKDWLTMLPPLMEFADAVVLSTPPSAPPERRWQPAEVVRSLDASGAIIEPDFARAADRAVELARGGTVVVTGSFHTVGAAFELLGVAPFARQSEPPSRVDAV